MPYNALAFVNCVRGNHEEAFNNLWEAEEILRKNHESEIEKWSIVTYGNAAWVYYHVGELEEAQSYLDKVERNCQQFPDASRYTAMIPEVYGEKGWSLLKFGWKYYKEASKCTEKALAADAENIEWNTAHATAMFRIKETSGDPPLPGDCKILKKALNLKPNSALLHQQIGLCYNNRLLALKRKPHSYYTREERKQLIELCKYHFQTTFDQKHSLYFAMLDLADIYEESEEYSKVDEISENLIRNEHCNRLSGQLILWNDGKYQLQNMNCQLNAIHHFKECLKLKVPSKRNEECRAKLEQIAEDRLDEYSRDSIAFGILGLIHQLDGRKSKAIEFYEGALECDRHNEEFQSALRELQEAALNNF
ncbi:interferon-induced protein with tetratricopeptide repeats 5-like [Mustelus asterias]